ncbi:MAG: PEGA domain-containing protein, partial [Acidobacteriota bacterium]|nr:PEGA domain-containing protein [Acidobacteriota bacterium]
VETPALAAAKAGTPVSAAATAGSGWVLVRTTPQGAGVTLDGAERGVTPLSIGDVPFGSRTVAVRREGFQPATREVAVSPSSPVVAVDVTLVPLPAIDGAPPAAVLGSLVVESRPPGARVTVAGSSAGTTPTIVSGLAAGPHEVRIELDGYLPWITSVDVRAAGEVRVAASLEGMGAR